MEVAVMDAKQEVLDTETGELALIPTIESDVTLDVFSGISETQVTREQSAILLADADPNELDILPTGEVYPPQVMVRRRLIKAFGAGGWAMRPLSKPKVSGVQLAQEWALYANGRFLSYTVGGANYQPNNARFTWSDATESLKSNALVRLCKDLGMFSECWDHRWTENWKSQYAIKVWVEGDKTPRWRRLDREPFYKETGVTDDSPNKDKYKRPAPQKTAPATTQKPVTTKPADNGSQPSQPQPTAPKSPATAPTPAPEPEKAPVSELDEALGRPSITEQERLQKAAQTNKSVVRFWDGEKWIEKPADETIKLATGTWFSQHFMGAGKAFENTYALFGQPSQKDVAKRGHLGKHYGRTDFVNPKSAMTWREFSELVAYAWWVQGDKEHGTLSLPRYLGKLDEELKKQDAIPYDEPAKSVVPTSADVVQERANKLGVDVLTLAQAAFGAETIHTLSDAVERQLTTLWQVLDAIELGNIKADDFDGQLEMIMLG